MWKIYAFAPLAAAPMGLWDESHHRRTTGRHEAASPPGLPPPGEPDAHGVYTVGGEIAPPMLRYSECAVYSERMLEIDEEGSVLVTAILGPDGIPLGADVLIPFMRSFDLAAIRATNEMRFEPATLNRAPVPVRIFVEFTFSKSKTPALPIMVEPGDALRPPVALYGVRPAYPRRARKQRQRGVVEISFTVTRFGFPADLEILRHAARDLEESAMQAVRRFRFQPAMWAGEPVPAHVTIDVVYRIFY
jgi:TonB family protein